MSLFRMGKISLVLAAASAGVHLMLLGGFALVSLSGKELSAELGAVSVQQAQQWAVTPLVTEKPQIEPKPEVLPEPEPVPEPQPAPVVASPSPEPEQPKPQSAISRSQPSIPSPQRITAGPSQNIEFFGNRKLARSVCFVVDCSGSMYGRLGMIRQQLKECVALLYDTQYFYIIFFMDGNKLLESGDGHLVAATGNAKADAFTMIDQARLGGQTNAIQALDRAMQLRDSGGRPVQLIYFLTDGFDIPGDREMGLLKTIEEMRKRNAPSVVINTIGFWASPEDQKRLSQMAHMTGGTFLHIE